MSGKLRTLSETASLLEHGGRLLVAGDEALLARLPAGAWIGGTIPYFMTADGGQVSRELLFVDELPGTVTDVKVSTYGPDELQNIPVDAYENGFSVVILPATSTVHERYAAEAAEIPGIFDRPVVGWVSGVHLDDLGTIAPKVFAGSGGARWQDRAVVLHAELAEGLLASAEIVNLFHQGDGPTLTFDETGFSQRTVRVDGQARSFGEFLAESGHDARLPLVADYFGAMINVSFQDVPSDGGAVSLYAPVFAGVEYKLAAPVGDYVTEFAAHLPHGSVSPAFSCNCILNFLYSELEGKTTGDIAGPITFGEIAFQLLNQTLVYLKIHE